MLCYTRRLDSDGAHPFITVGAVGVGGEKPLGGLEDSDLR